MPNYADGKIYKLFVSDDDTRCYIGSTTQDLNRRLIEHKYAHKKQKKHHTYASSILFNNNAEVQIELLEAVNCTTKEQLIARERYWFNNTPTAINTQVPGQTKKQYREQIITCNICSLQLQRNSISRHQKTHQN